MLKILREKKILERFDVFLYLLSNKYGVKVSQIVQKQRKKNKSRLIMQKLLFILILLINFLSIKSQVCKESTKKASLIFYHYCPERPNGMTRISITTSIVSKYQADFVYVLTGNQTNENTLNVLRVRCERINYNLNDCSQYFKSN